MPLIQRLKFTSQFIWRISKTAFRNSRYLAHIIEIGDAPAEWRLWLAQALNPFMSWPHAETLRHHVFIWQNFDGHGRLVNSVVILPSPGSFKLTIVFVFNFFEFLGHF